MATTDNPLSAFFRGLQGAQQRAVQQAQQVEENELTRQLREIQLLNAQKQILQASRTPQQVLSEQLQEAFAVDALKRGALVQSALGLEGQAIALPSAIDQTAVQLEAQAPLNNALSQLMTTPTAPMKGFELPVTGLPGFNVSEEAARQKTAQDVSKAAQLAKAKVDATPAGYTMFTDALGNVSYQPKIPGRGEAQVALNPEGGQLKGRVPVASARDLTPNAQANVLAKAGTAKITSEEITSKYTKDGVTDWNRLIIDSNKKISEDKSLAAEEKLNQIPAAERAKANGMIAAHKGLTRLITEVNKFKVEGKEPDAWNRAVATALEAPPDGIFSALYQSAVGQSLTGDDQTVNALKAMVRSAVTKANAGLSQTEREIANVSQYVPKSNDTIEETLRKGALLETYLIDQVEAITTNPKDWLSSIKAGEAAPTATPPTATGSSKVGRFTVTPR